MRATESIARWHHIGAGHRHLTVLALIVICPLFFFGGPDWASGPLHKALWNLGHILFFALLAIATRPWRRWQGWRLWLVVTLVVLSMGIGIEVVQDGFERDADARDLLRNLIGAWLVLAWHRTGSAPDSRGHAAGRTLLRVATVGLLAIELMIIAQVAHRQWQVWQLPPALYDADAEPLHDYWSGNLKRVNGVNRALGETGSSHPALAIQLNTEHFSGVSLHNLPGDWRGYRQLRLALRNPSDRSLAMTIRINDTRHDRSDNAFTDRFNRRLTLAPGHNVFTIDLDDVRTAPAHRPMDMHDIRRLGLFTVDLPTPQSVYLLGLTLTP